MERRQYELEAARLDEALKRGDIDIDTYFRELRDVDSEYCRARRERCELEVGL